MKRIIVLAALCAGAVAAGAYAATPTPIAGGANQAAGVAGTFGDKLFNGEVRLTPRTVRNATPQDGLTSADGQKWVVFTAAAGNGTGKDLDMQQFTASVADADGDTYQAQPDKVKPIGGVFGVPPGGKWNEQILFDVPATFNPVKIVLRPYDGKHPAFRITVRASDYADK
jgi:hypothetical protein